MQVLATPGEKRLLVKNRLLRVSPFDDAGSTHQVLCEIPARYGKTYRLRMSASAFQKLQAFNGNRSIGEAVDHCYPGDNDPAARSAFEEFITGPCVSSGLLVDKGASEEAALSSRTNPNPMLLQRSLLGPEFVAAVASPLVALYRPPIVALAVIAIGVGQLASLLSLTSAKHRVISDLLLSDVCWALLILGVGLFFHEFGHAAAAHRHGCRSTRIGVGLYICFPVFYADLSESWRLSRLQRIAVDCGGIYFQALFISLLVAVNGFVSEPSLTYSILALNVALIWNFNPFLKLDGYWLASDLMGVANLRGEAAAAFRSVWRKSWLGRSAQVDHCGSGLGVRTQFALFVYWIASMGFFIWLAEVMVFTTIPALLVDMHLLYTALALDLETQTRDFLTVTVGKLAWKGLSLAVMVYVLYRFSRPVLVWFGLGAPRARERKAATD